MTEEQAKLYAKKTFEDDDQKRLDVLSNYWEDPREKFNDSETHTEKKKDILIFIGLSILPSIVIIVIEMLCRT